MYRHMYMSEYKHTRVHMLVRPEDNTGVHSSVLAIVFFRQSLISLEFTKQAKLAMG